MDYIAKMAAALPKESDLNGFADQHGPLTEDLWGTYIEGKFVRPRVALLVYGVEDAAANKKGERVVKLVAQQIQPVLSTEGRQLIETVLRLEYEAAHGSLLPHTVKTLWKQVFADLPRTPEQIDEMEERERDTMSPGDELRAHLERGHGAGDVEFLSDEEAAKRHDADHQQGRLPETLQHAPDWIGWSRADLEQASAETEGENAAFDAETAAETSAAMRDGLWSNEPAGEVGEPEGDAPTLLDDPAAGSQGDDAPGADAGSDDEHTGVIRFPLREDDGRE